MTAVTLAPHPARCGGGVGNLVLQLCSSFGWSCGVVIQLLVRKQRFVGWEPHSGRKQSCYLFTSAWCERLLKSVHALVCGVSYRPISTGQLHESLVLASTSGLSTQWSGWGPLTRKVYGNLISKRASRLDAFSGYPIRT